jgi:hypothetical protein
MTIYTREGLRPQPSYPTYPPYHVGEYLEDYFYKDYIKHSPNLKRDYIAVSWTTLYCENKTIELEQFLNSLDGNGSYFTIMQHDEAPKHKLPSDTICFSASQARPNPLLTNLIQIPVVCSRFPYKPNNTKNIFCSFVGSYTNNIRLELQQLYGDKSDYYFSQQMWNPSIPKDRLDHFIDVASRSKFTLCPRGYGNTSFRMYEVMQLGSIPVYITDYWNLPWSDELNWQEFCVLVPHNEIHLIDEKLKNISDSQYQSMLERMNEVYESHFTLESLYPNIIKRLS